MFVIIGMIIVLASVFGGYSIHGNLSVLFQPIELLIIGGAAVGGFIIQTPSRMLGAVIKKVLGVFTGRSTSKKEFIDILALLNEIFSKMRKEGLIAIESDIENPAQSPIFSKYPSIIRNKHALSYICDNLKVIISTNVSPHELDDVMEYEIETHHKHSMIPAHSITKVADALPGLGIVAAVLGVVLTMGKISEPPEVLGASIAAALVGTFLGILMCYGFVGPMATNMEHAAEEGMISFQVIKIALVSFVGGAAPQIAVEFARRVIPSDAKPSFNELEEALR